LRRPKLSTEKFSAWKKKKKKKKKRRREKKKKKKKNVHDSSSHLTVF
jgi:hypothetical protein